MQLIRWAIVSGVDVQDLALNVKTTWSEHLLWGTVPSPLEEWTEDCRGCEWHVNPGYSCSLMMIRFAYIAVLENATVFGSDWWRHRVPGGQRQTTPWARHQRLSARQQHHENGLACLFAWLKPNITYLGQTGQNMPWEPARERQPVTATSFPGIAEYSTEKSSEVV